MADIELVIKIPEEAKQAFDCAESNDLKGCYYDHGGVVGNAIKNGTPLPKGHGNLIQREEAETIFRNAKMALYKQSRTEQIKDFQTRESMLLNAEQFVHSIKPIIEADKAEDDGTYLSYQMIEEVMESEIVLKWKERRS